MRKGISLRVRLLTTLSMCSFWMFAQEADFQTLYKHTDSICLLDMDVFDQIYFVDDKNGMYKLTHNGEVQFAYTNNRLGTITSIDVSNPLNILVFYRNQGKIKILDRTLNVARTVDLYKLGFYDCRAVAIGGEDRIWLFDRDAQKLIRIDPNETVLYESPDLRMQFDRPLEVRSMIVHERQLFLLTERSEVLIFDEFGTYRRSIQFGNAEKIRVEQNAVFALSHNDIESYDLQSLMPRKAPVDRCTANKASCIWSDLRMYCPNNNTLQTCLLTTK